MAVHWGGVVAIVIFYLMILGVGLWAARKGKGSSDTEDVMVAGRNIGLAVGIFTMTGEEANYHFLGDLAVHAIFPQLRFRKIATSRSPPTWVGGGYINGTAEYVYTSGLGLLWTQAPWGYAASLVLGGLLFAKQMRSQGYVTMLDPFQLKYGSRMGGLLFLPALMGELCWSAAILSALGATISVILDLNMEISVTISACIAAFYTFFGGLYSVAYTDVVQLLCIFFGLWLCIPFAMTNEAVLPITNTSTEWVGTWDNKYAGVWFDYALLLMFGGIPWQVYFQRVLSSKSAERAQALSYIAAVGCILMAVPPILIGAIGYGADWSQTGIDLNRTRPEENPELILPLVIQYLTPPWVSFVGLGAVSAAVMSSADSSILSASSLFVRNVYKLVFRQSATERELLWVLRIAIVVVTALALVMGLTIKSVYALWFLCSDFVYVILFPQLFCVVYFSKVNTYGSLVAYIVALILRLGGGDTTLKIAPFIKYPLYNDDDGQLFPFRTFAMAMSFFTLLLVSYGTNFLFMNGYLRKQFDVFQCVVNIPELHREKYDTVDGENLQLKTIQTDGPVDGIQPGATDILQRDKLLDIGRSIIPESISKEPLKDDMDDSPATPDSPE